jgi:acetolactate synthase regulatory subunit
MPPQNAVPLAQRRVESAERQVVAAMLVLDVRDSPDVLVRVLTTLRRRGCAIASVEYRASGEPMRIGIAAPAACVHCVQAWLMNLVDVLSVDHVPA